MELVETELDLVNPLDKSPFYILIETSGSNEEHDNKVSGIACIIFSTVFIPL